ncbi:MAG TPA: hypothetical protein VN810_02085 [Terriglobales bacterium]|nr:hypothetical protein [Terriglobales bacterium]
MKRGLTLALLALATSVVVSAQIHGGGGHASAGASRGATSGFRGSASSAGPRSFAGGVPAQRVGSGIAFGHHPGFVTGSRGRDLHHRRYYPGIVGPYYWPYYGSYYPYDAYYSNDYQPNQAVADSAPDDDRYGDHSYNEQRSSPPPRAQAPAAPEPEQDPTVLVFRDGHKQEVRNYAIVGQMLWDFGAKGTHKIPLADLDLDTTRKLNDERGVDFVLPKG